MISLRRGRNFFVTLDDLLTLPASGRSQTVPIMINAHRLNAIRFVKLDDLAIPTRPGPSAAIGTRRHRRTRNAGPERAGWGPVDRKSRWKRPRQRL
jgi:hypothetical protein